jgi:hypothetical protein
VYAPVDGRPAPDSTDVLVWYSAKAIHVGRRATGHRVPRQPTRRKGDGIVVEGSQSGGGGFGGAYVGREPTDISPAYVFHSKGQLTDFGYVVEVSIPFKTLQFSDAPKQTWGLNIIRKVQSRGEEHSWAPAKRAAASYIGQFGKLTGLESLDRGLVLDVTPIVTARADGRRVEGSCAARWVRRR